MQGKAVNNKPTLGLTPVIAGVLQKQEALDSLAYE